MYPTASAENKRNATFANVCDDDADDVDGFHDGFLLLTVLM